MKTLKACLATVKDPRRGQGERYDLVHTLCSRWMRCIIKKTVEQVTASSSDLLCQVKSNQPKLYKVMRRQAKHRPGADSACSCAISGSATALSSATCESEHVKVVAA